jgi:hypothetical protein
MVGLSPSADFLSFDWLKMLDPDRAKAQALFRSFVIEGIERSSETAA